MRVCGVSVIVLVALVVAACGGAGKEAAGPVGQETLVASPRLEVDRVALAVSSTRSSAAPACRRGEIRRIGNRRVAYAVVLKRPSVVFRRPGRRPLARFQKLNRNGFPTVFGVRAVVLDASCNPVWYRVQLPIRPNGASGFVKARAIELHRVYTRIVIDLSRRELVVYRSGRRMLHTKVAVGAPGTPTPAGAFYVNQRLRPADPGGPYGPAALGISAFSPVLTGWAQDGPIAIHGTDEPASIGQPASHGCVRVTNGLMESLYRRIPAGTPVLIKA